MASETTVSILTKLHARARTDLNKILEERCDSVTVVCAEHTMLKGKLRPDVKISVGKNELAIDATQGDFPWCVLTYCKVRESNTYCVLERIDTLEENVFNALLPDTDELVLEWLSRTQAIFRNLFKYWNDDDKGMSINQFIDTSLRTSTANSIGSFSTPTHEMSTDDDSENESAQGRSRSSSRERAASQEDARLVSP